MKVQIFFTIMIMIIKIIFDQEKKEIMIKIDYKASNELVNITMGNIQLAISSGVLTPVDYTKIFTNIIEFTIKTEINETWFLAAQITFGTTFTIKTSTAFLHWNYTSSITSQNVIIDGIETSLSAFGSSAAINEDQMNIKDKSTFVVLNYKIPDSTIFCNNTETIIFQFDDVNPSILFDVYLEKYVFQKYTIPLFFQITNNPTIGTLYSSNILVKTGDQYNVLTSVKFKPNNIYGKERISIVFNKNNPVFSTQECFLNIVVCWKSCETCLDLKPDLSNHNCIKCKKDYYPSFDKPSVCYFYDPDILIKGFYFDINANFFFKCSPNCKFCNRKNDCKQCETDYVFSQRIANSNDKECLKKLAPSETIYDGYYLGNTIPPIEYYRCAQFCNTCSGYGDEFIDQKCDTCRSNYSTIEGKIGSCVTNDLQIDGYVFEIADSKYYKCYSKCFNCLKIGNDYKHNCLTCLPNYYRLPSYNCIDVLEISLNKFLPDVSLLYNTDKTAPNTIITLYNYTYAFYQLNNQYLLPQNIPSINLGECEVMIRIENNLSQTDLLFIAQLSSNRTSLASTDCNFKLYNSKGIEMNIESCRNTTIEITKPLNMLRTGTDISIANQLKEIGYDQFDTSSPFYHDLCIFYATANNIDTTLDDRRNYIYTNVSICKPGCTYEIINYNSNSINCKCQLNIIKNPVIHKSFNDNYSRNILNLFQCAKVFLNLNVINISVLYGLPVIGISIISTVLFFIVSQKKISKEVKDYLIPSPPYKNKSAFKNKKKDINNNKEYEVNKDNNGKINNRNMQNTRKQQDYDYNNLKMNSYDPSTPTTYKGEADNDNYDNNIDSYNKRNKHISDMMNGNVAFDSKVFLDQMGNKINYSKHEDEEINTNIPNEKNDSVVLQEVKVSKRNIKNYTPELLNVLPFIQAFRNDHRTYCECFYHLLTVREILISLFFFKATFYSVTSRLILFLFNISSLLFFNALFFTNKDISNRFTSKTPFTLGDSINKEFPRSIYAALLSLLTSKLIFLFTSSSASWSLAKEDCKTKEQYNAKCDKILSRFNTKVIFCSLFVIIISIVYYYFIAIFCFLFRNNQLFLIISTLMSLIYEIVLQLILCGIISSIRCGGLSIENR